MKVSEEISLLKVSTLWLITLAYMGLIYFLSSLSGDRLPGLSHGSDKIIHTCAYAVMSFLCFNSLSRSGIKRHCFLIALLLTSIYAVSDEFHQYYVPGRYASIGDLIADFIGAFIGSSLASAMICPRRIGTDGTS
jgi:VanZ family protein